MSTPEERRNILFGGNSSFSASLTRMLSSWLMKVVEVWLSMCLEKYDEAYFHKRMSEGFSFISDWKLNHSEKYSEFVRRARKVRHLFKIDEQDILDRAEKMLKKQGWKLYDTEKQMILEDIRQLKRDIYGAAYIG